MADWHFTLNMLGASLMFIALHVGGFFQGLQWATWADGDSYRVFQNNLSKLQFLDTIASMHYFWLTRTISGLFIFAGNCIFVVNVFNTILLKPRTQTSQGATRCRRNAGIIMTDPHVTPKIERSAIYTMIGIALLFLSSILATVIAPNLIDPSWVEPSSHFQVQMYEVADPNLYAARALPGAPTLDYVHHLKQGYSLLAFQETEQLRILADLL